MSATPPGVLDEAYARLHHTGPEFSGWLSNHGPMAVEAMVRHGHGDAVDLWLGHYMRRLEEFPRGLGPIGADWRSALGDPRRIADWTAEFDRQLHEQAWQQVLNEWWPRLLPGLVAAATHGVIRVGHAVQCLLTGGPDATRLTELAHGMAYWAARWQTIPAGNAAAAAAGRAGPASLAQLISKVPRIADQTGGIGARLDRLAAVAWLSPLDDLTGSAGPERARALLTELVDTATVRYLAYGHGNGIMLVHSATAPNAVLRTLPALDREAWLPSLAAAWAASSALTAIYAPTEGSAAAAGEPTGGPAASVAAAARADIGAETFAAAVEHGDEHVIKFADTAVEVLGRTGDQDAVAAARRAMELIERP
jgi:Questin oxidase-like